MSQRSPLDALCSEKKLFARGPPRCLRLLSCGHTVFSLTPLTQSLQGIGVPAGSGLSYLLLPLLMSLPWVFPGPAPHLSLQSNVTSPDTSPHFLPKVLPCRCPPHQALLLPSHTYTTSRVCLFPCSLSDCTLEGKLRQAEACHCSPHCPRCCLKE